MVQTYQRNELPPGATGLVKPGFELADRSGEQRFAGMIVGTAADLWKQAIETQAGLEYTDFIGKVKTAEAEFESFVTKNPNETMDTYTAQQTKMLADIQKAGGTAKTNVARQRIRQFYNANENLIREQTSTSAAAIVRKHQLDVFNTNLDAAVKAGDVATVNRIHSESGRSLLGDDLAGIKAKDDLNLAVYHKAQNDISLEPQAFLDAVKDGTAKGYETLQPDQVHALTTYANAVKQFRKNQADELTVKQIQAIHELARKSTSPQKEGESQITPEYVKAKIDQSDGLTPVQKTEAWKQYNEALSVRAKTGQNPYTTTQDWTAYMQMKIDIASGKITTPMQIYTKMLSEPQKGPLWSYVQMNDLVTDLPDNKNDILKTPFYDEWDKQIDVVFVKDGDIPKDKIPEWARAKDQLKQIAAIVGQDYEKAQKLLEEFLTPVKKEKAKGWLSQWWQDMKESPLLGEGAVHRRNRLLEEAKAGYIVEVTSEKEKEMLPKGTLYRNKGSDQVYERI